MVKEDIIVNEKVIKNKVTDKDWSIYLGNSSEKTLVTEKLNIVVDSFIITADKECEILIRFHELPDIIVYHVTNFRGTKYIPVRISTITPQNELLLYAFTKWTINNKLDIIIVGQNHTRVNITLRC